MRTRKDPSEIAVAIIGAGPSAAFATAALKDKGVGTIDIYTLEEGVAPAGSFYVHMLPDSYSMDEYPGTRLITWGIGSGTQYIWNQYGNLETTTESSFPNVMRASGCWDYAQLQPALLSGASNITTGWRLTDDGQLLELASEYDIVMHSVPTMESAAKTRAPVAFPVFTFKVQSCNNGKWNRFLELLKIQRKEITNWAVYAQGNQVPGQITQPNFVLYNGTQLYKWVRLSYLWQNVHVEMPVGYQNRRSEWLAQVVAETGCRITMQRSLHPETERWSKRLADNIHPIGRMARWDKRILSHNTYSHASGILSGYTTDG